MKTNIQIALKASETYAPLKGEALTAFASILECRKYKRNEMILEEGDTCRSIMFIEEGLVRQYYYKHDKDLTEHISYGDGVVMCIESLFKEEPTRLMVEALEPTTLWHIPKTKLDELSMQYPEIGRLYRKFMEWSLIESQIKADSLRFETAADRYVNLLKRHPQIIQRAPLIYIASMLEMTPETLSRVRSEVLKRG